MKKAKKLIDGCKDKLELVVKRESKYISNRADDLRYPSIYGNRRNANETSGRPNWSNQNVYVQPPTRSMVPMPPPPIQQPVPVDVRDKAMFTDDPALLKKEEADREDYYGTPANDFAALCKRYPTNGSAPSSASSTDVKKRKSYSHRNSVAGISTKSATLGHSSSKSDRIRSGHHHHSARSSMAAPPPPTLHADEVRASGPPDRQPAVQKLSAKQKEEVDREDYYGTPAKDFAGLFDRYPNGPITSNSPIIEKKRKSFSSSNRNSVAGSPSKSSTAAANNGNSNNLPPRVDRGRKPERFKSAHERLFGKGSGGSEEQPQLQTQQPEQQMGSNRDSIASPEYMNSSSFSVPSSSTLTTATTPYSCVKSVTRTVSTVSSTGSSSTPYLRSKYQSFLSDLIRTKEPPPPPPPKPSNYQSVYLTKENRTPRLNPPPPVVVTSNAVFPPPPPVTPPTPSACPPTSIANYPPPPPPAASAWFADPDLEPPYESRPLRHPPPSAQDLLLTTRR